MSSAGKKRWWEDYLVRYFMPSIAGVAIVLWLGDIAGTGFQKLLWLPKTTSELDTPTVILLLLYGNLYCYVASYPILSFHATRVLDFKGSTWRKSLLRDGYIVTAFLSVLVLFISLCLHNECRYWLAFLLAIFFSTIQLNRICDVWKPEPGNGVSPAYGYARKLAERRSLSEETPSEDLTDDDRKTKLWSQDLVNTYRHLREHGNSGFIFLLELTLAGLTYCIVVNIASSDPQKQLSAVGILFAIWAFPAVFVHLLAQHLERSFSEYRGRN